ncbi:aminotransferase [Talaromyces pinophilus]|uniref:superoxide dismutase n=1 Tax=Talaromyces pinophilus TaxID=128442 RepID=A0A698XM39_TALPI|nr:aminotransferase [Talaromyces pinophilus]
MLSSRGETYAKAGLADGYLRPREPYNKGTKEGIVSFGNAENFLMQDILLEYIRTKAFQHLDNASLTYHEGPFGPKRLREAMAKLIIKYFHPAIPISPDHVLFTSGITSLNAMYAMCLTDPGDGILLGQPIYGSFNGDLQVPSGCQLIYTPFHEDDPFGRNAVEHYEETFLQAREKGVSIKALLICNPHNPLGRCYPRDTLEALMQFCQKYQIHLISDEIYALSVYEEDPSSGFVSILSIDPAPLGVDPAIIHVLYGMSKDFAAAGLRLGCLISRNQKFMHAALSISRFHWPSEISCSIATTLLEDHEFIDSFLRKSRERLRSQRDFAVQILDEAGIPYARGCNAGFFLWIDLSKCLNARIVDTQEEWAAELDLSQQLQEIGVEMSSGYAYHNETAGWFRVIFSVEREILEEGLSRQLALPKMYTLPPLPYAYEALEPVISAEIMTLHHQKHHQTYINNLNAALSAQQAATTSNDIPALLALQQKIKFNGGGHINHSLFWRNLAPAGSAETNINAVAPNIKASIEVKWGSVDNFINDFKQTLLGIQGSGWGWLIVKQGPAEKKTRSLEIVTTKDQDSVVAPDESVVPLFGVDMWEHAYYLQVSRSLKSSLEGLQLI